MSALKAIETGKVNPTILVLNKIAKALETNVTILTDVNYNTNTIDTRKSLIDLVYSLNQKQFKILNNAVSLLCEHPYQFWKRIRDVVMKDYEERINEIELWEFYSKKNNRHNGYYLLLTILLAANTHLSSFKLEALTILGITELLSVTCENGSGFNSFCRIK